jgi:transcription antitermination factor NusG
MAKLDSIFHENKAGGKTFEPLNQLCCNEKRWFAVYTKVKCEKYVQENLLRKNIECYLPLMSRTKRYTRKIKRYEVPLINCYIFVHITKDQYVSVLETEYVFKFIKQGHDLIAIPELEINTLKKITGFSADAMSIHKSSFDIGTEVEVSRGNLAGIKGRIINKNNKNSFIVELYNIGFQFRINIESGLLAPVFDVKSFAAI